MNLASYIDHTLLKPDAVASDIEKLCAEAVQYSFASVCVNPCRVPLVAEYLSGSGVAVCSVAAFPLGANSTESKLSEVAWCVDNGAAEVDIVMNVGEAKAGNWDYVEGELTRVAEFTRSKGVLLKVIVETCLLDREEKIEAATRVVAAKADFVKTSTGFAGGGATNEDVELLVETVKGRCRVKASGGIKTRADAESMIRAGAARLGSSSGIAIVS